MPIPSGSSRARRQSGYARQDQSKIWRAAAASVAPAKIEVVQLNLRTGTKTGVTQTFALNEIRRTAFNTELGKSYAAFSAYRRPYATIEQIAREILNEGANVYTESFAFCRIEFFKNQTAETNLIN